MQFRDDGWLNATSVSLRFGKEVKDWLRQADVLEYICALADDLNINSCFLQDANVIKELHAALAKRMGNFLIMREFNDFKDLHAGNLNSGFLRQFNEIKELHAGNLNSAGARAKIAAFIQGTG